MALKLGGLLEGPEPNGDKHWDFTKLQLVEKDGDVDLRPYTSPRHSQGSTNSCVANAVCKALEIQRILKQGPQAHVDLSRMALYYLARELDRKQDEDNGTHISLACDALRRFGVPLETDWPWHPARVNHRPDWDAMRSAYGHKIKAFYKIKSSGEDRVKDVIRALRGGCPVVFGTVVGAQWGKYKKDAILKEEKSWDGRHATVLIGYQDGVFIGENSWGVRWGDQGFYKMDPEVIASSTSGDFWVIQAPWV